MILAIARRLARLRELASDRSGLALVEFALALPLLLTLTLTGAELTNYITVRMRVSQLALHLADNAARVGVGGPREAKKVYESDIYDLLDGAEVQAVHHQAGRYKHKDLHPCGEPGQQPDLGHIQTDVNSP